MPIVSIIVPVYNCEKYLSRCVDSLISQTLRDIEIVLVDDGSKDASGRICDSYAGRDSRIRVVHCPNGGVSSARNKGIEMASGCYVSFVDSDDWMDSKSYELLVAKAEDNDSDIVYCDYAEVYSDNIQNRKSFPVGSSWETTVWNMIEAGPRGGNIFSFCLTRKSLLVENDLTFPSHLRRGEDFWFTLHVYLNARRIDKVEKVLYYYDLSNVNSATHTEKIDATPSYLYFMDECKNYLIEKECWDRFSKIMNHRILLEKTAWVLNPSCFASFRKIHPEVNFLVEDNPFLGGKMKIMIRLLNNHFYIVASLLSFAYKLKERLMS